MPALCQTLYRMISFQLIFTSSQTSQSDGKTKKEDMGQSRSSNLGPQTHKTYSLPMSRVVVTVVLTAVVLVMVVVVTVVIMVMVMVVMVAIVVC